MRAKSWAGICAVCGSSRKRLSPFINRRMCSCSAAEVLEIPREAVDHVIKHGTNPRTEKACKVLCEFTVKHGVSLDYLISNDLESMFRYTAIRTATTDGIIMLTFTPLAGMSEVVMGFLPEMRIQDGA